MHDTSICLRSNYWQDGCVVCRMTTQYLVLITQHFWRPFKKFLNRLKISYGILHSTWWPLILCLEKKSLWRLRRFYPSKECSWTSIVLYKCQKKLAGTVDKIPILTLKQYKKITHIYLIHLFIYLISYYEAKKSDKDNTPTI